MTFLKAVTTIGFWTALSRIAGMVREILMSHYMGVSILSDAFVVAFKLPNFFRRFFADGAFNAAFVPLFSQKLSKNPGHTQAHAFAAAIFTIGTLFMVLFTIIFILLTPWSIPLIAPGLASDTLDLAISFARITFPYILCASLTSLFSGILVSFNRFGAPSAIPLVLNVVMILALIMAPTSEQTGLYLSTAVLIAGVLQVILLMMITSHHQCRPYWAKPVLSPDVKEFLRKLGPGMVGAGVMQINMLIDLQLASYLPQGSLSYLYYADRLYQLPLSVFGIAVSTALLPNLSRAIESKNPQKIFSLQQKALAFVWFINVPAAVGLCVLSLPIITLLFSHGAFLMSDVMKTAPALQAYAIGLPAYGCCKVLTTFYFARKDTKTPVMIGIWVIGVNFALNIILMRYWAHVGLALATSLAAYVHVFLLYFMLYREKFFALNRQFISFSVRCLGIAALMGGGILIGFSYLQHIGSVSSVLINALRLFITIGFGCLFYGGCCYYGGIQKELNE